MRNHLQVKHSILDPERKVTHATATPSETTPPPPETSQLSIPNLFKKMSPLTKEKKEKLDNLLIRFISANQQPFSLAEQKDFINYSNELNERYTVPCAKTIKTLIINEAANVREILKKRIQDIKYDACACIDMWSSDAQDSYLGVDIHFITRDFELEDFTLCVKPLEYPHTAVRIAEALRSVFDDFGLHGKVTTVVIDNCSNMVALEDHFPDLEFLRCAIHTFQLSVKSLFTTNIDVLTKTRRLVNYFCRSNKQRESLIKAQEFSRPGKTAVSYIIDMAVRWNSTFAMLKRVLELRTSLEVLTRPVTSGSIGSSNEYSSLQAVLLSDAEYSKISVLLKLLTPLTQVSSILQSSKRPTISSIYPFATLLLSFYENPVEDEAMDETRKVILKDLKDRWGPPSESMLISCFLDPRFKCLFFAEEQMKQKAVDRVRCLYLQEQVKERGRNLPSDLNEANSATENAREGLYAMIPNRTIKKVKVEDEMDRYLELPLASESDEKFDLLGWWKVHENSLPHLSVLARRYMCRMPSTASIESVFSIAGNILGVNRYSLKANRVNDLLVLKKYYTGVV